MGSITTITVTDPPFGAIGDGGVHLFDPAHSPPHPAWVGHYTAGVDTLDFIGLQEAIYAAFGAPGREHGVQDARRNLPLYIPPGVYLLNKPLQLTHVCGGRIVGGGRMATILVETSTATPVLNINGMSYSRIEGVAFRCGAGTLFAGRWRPGHAYAAGASVSAIDGSVWRTDAAGTAGAAEPAWTTPATTDGSMRWTPVKGFALVNLDWDGAYAGGWTAACQSNTFADCHFSGENRGVPIGVAVAPSGDRSMGSENLFTNCFWIWFTTAGLATLGFNALQNTVVGGNFENCARYAIWYYKGAGTVVSTGFQNGFLEQIANRGADIAFANSANDASAIIGCRTESGRFVVVENAHKVSVRGCAIVPPMDHWRPSRAVQPGATIVGVSNTDGIAYTTSAAGTTAATEPIWDAATGSVRDGSVTWTPITYDALAGANLSVDDTVVLYGCVALQSQPTANGHVHGCSFSRADWLRSPGTGAWSILNNIVNLAGGPNNSHGVARYAVDPVATPGAPMHRAIMALGGDTALLFPAPATSTPAHTSALPSVGITRGDPQRDILGVYGAIGRPTPIAPDGVTAPRDASGADLILLGGLGTGTGVPGRIALQTADSGPPGALVNDPVTRLVVADAGVGLGAGSPLLRRIVSATLAWRPGRIPAGESATSEGTLYGARVGDVVSVATLRPLPAGCLLQATVTAADAVRVELFNLSRAPVTVDPGRVRVTAMLYDRTTDGTPSVDDVARLVRELGGSAVTAVYDARVGVSTASDATVRQWADARGGSGFGPTLTLSGPGPAPIHNPVAGTVTGRGGSALLSAPSAGFDLGTPLSLIFVGAITRVWSEEPRITLGLGNGARSLTLEARRDGAIGATMDDRWSATGPVAASSATRLVILTSPSGGALTLGIAGAPAVSEHVATAYPAGGYRLAILGAPVVPLPAGATSVVRAVLVLRGSLDADRSETVRQWAAAIHGAEAAAGPPHG